jgi:hypothetical protein
LNSEAREECQDETIFFATFAAKKFTETQ